MLAHNKTSKMFFLLLYNKNEIRACEPSYESVKRRHNSKELLTEEWYIVHIHLCCHNVTMVLQSNFCILPAMESVLENL